MLRVLLVVPFAPDGSDAVTVFRFLEQLPTRANFAGFETQAPILFLPDIFEIDFCRRLVDLYKAHGGEESGIWDVIGGKAVPVHDHARKRRKDYVIKGDHELIRQLQIRVSRRIFPEILKAYAFKATHIERYMISCYSAEEQGHFAAHRDNTTRQRRTGVSPFPSI